MQAANHQLEDQTAVRTNLGAIFVSLELSRSTRLITSLSPGGGEKMSKHSVRSGDVARASLFATQGERADGRGSQSSSPKRRDWMVSHARWIGRASKATLSTPPRLRLRVGVVGRRPTGSTEMFEHCWHTNETNRASARWSGRPTPEDEDRRRISRERKTRLALFKGQPTPCPLQGRWADMDRRAQFCLAGAYQSTTSITFRHQKTMTDIAASVMLNRIAE